MLNTITVGDYVSPDEIGETLSNLLILNPNLDPIITIQYQNGYEIKLITTRHPKFYVDVFNSKLYSLLNLSTIGIIKCITITEHDCVIK